jgi:hypothetical protein
LVGLGAVLYKDGHFGAFKAWSVAKDLDKKGGGKAELKEITAFIIKQGISKKTARLWVKQALDLGYFRGVSKARCKRTYFYNQGGEVARKLDLEDIGYKVEVRADKFLKRKGSRALVWAAYLLTTQKERPRSQRSRKRETGITTRMQRYYQSQVKPHKKANWLKLGICNQENAEHLARFSKGYYVIKRGQVYERKPDTLTIKDFDIRRAGGRHARKRAKKVLASSPSCISGRGTAKENFIRLFHNTHKQLKKTLDNLKNVDAWDRPSEVYLRENRRSNKWVLVPVC